jgi:hypothetical protein
MRLLRGLIIGLIFMLLLGNQGVAVTQVERTRYFDETGQWVTGDFLDFYERVPEPEKLYGNPITPAFDSSLSKDPSGTIIQYFEKARFELHPENLAYLRVTLTRLGEYFYQHDDIKPSTRYQKSPYACQSFSEDRPPVCYEFLQYFNLNDGVAQFGYPISELVIYENRSVQYFERAVFEWYPEQSGGEIVALADLGTRYFYAIGENPPLLDPDSIPAKLVELRVNAFVERAIMPPNGLQEVYVVVQNQILQPVSEAHVSIQIFFPSGEMQIFSMPLTNSDGVSQVRLIVKDEPAGLARVVVVVRTFDKQVTSETSFRVWK